MRLQMWMFAIVAATLAVADRAASQEGAPAAPRGGSAAAIGSGGAELQSAGGHCQLSADRLRAMRLDRALNVGFGVQYWGDRYTAEGLAEQPHGLLIIEAAKVGALYSESGREEFFSPEEIATMSRGGERPVLGYLNASEIENYRDYWIDSAAGRNHGEVTSLPAWFGPHAGHGDHLSAFWVSEWRDVLLSRVDRLMASGVDGLFLDDVLHYYSHASDKNLVWPGTGRPNGPEDAPGLARAMMELVIVVAERVRAWDCGAFVVVNNGVFIGRDAGETAEGDRLRPVFDAYLSAIDAILVENVLSPAAHPNTRLALEEDFLNNGVKVLTLDVVPPFRSEGTDEQRQRMVDEASEAGFFPYVVEDGGFNRLWAPIARFEKS